MRSPATRIASTSSPSGVLGTWFPSTSPRRRSSCSGPSWLGATIRGTIRRRLPSPGPAGVYRNALLHELLTTGCQDARDRCLPGLIASSSRQLQLQLVSGVQGCSGQAEHRFFLGTGDMTKIRLGIVRVVAHPAARMFA